MTVLAELERKGLITRISTNSRRVKDLLRLAARDLRVARTLNRESPDWAYSIAYNRMLQSARALMFSRGYRPTGTTSHFAVIAFLRSAYSQQLGTLIGELDRMRKKRHVSVYDTAGTISDREMREISEGLRRLRPISSKLSDIAGTKTISKEDWQRAQSVLRKAPASTTSLK